MSKTPSIKELSNILRCFDGIDIQHRRYGAKWPGKWRATIHNNETKTQESIYAEELTELAEKLKERYEQDLPKIEKGWKMCEGWMWREILPDGRLGLIKDKEGRVIFEWPYDCGPEAEYDFGRFLEREGPSSKKYTLVYTVDRLEISPEDLIEKSDFTFSDEDDLPLDESN